MIFKKQKQEVSQPDDDQMTASIEQFNNTLDNSFFYTNDKKLNAIDEDDIIAQIAAKYPDFKQQTKDSQLKKVLIQILQDEAFMKAVLKHFDLDLHEFIKIMYKHFSTLFNSLFIKKVRDAIDGRSYA